MLKTVRTNFDRHEMRRDRRYVTPELTVTIAQTDYTALDWSLGGFRLVDGPDVGIGGKIKGTLRIAGAKGLYAFSAEAVRHDGDAKALAFHFVDRSDALVTVLDRAIAGRLMRKRR